jgi:hypothetical protein
MSTLQYSSDGIHWTAATSGGFDSAIGVGVAFSPALGQWLAFGATNGDSTSTIQVSTDGSNWVGVNPNGFVGSGRAASYSATTGQWVAVGDNATDGTSTIQTSPDGSNWTSATTGGFQPAGYGVLATPNVWIAAGQASDYASTLQWTTDWTNWFPAVTGGFDGLDGYNVAWNGNVGSSFFVAVGNSLIDPTSTIQWSSDGSNWNPIVTGGFDTGAGSAGIVYNPDGGIWTAVGKRAGGSNTIQTSTDGIHWTSVQSGGFYYHSFADGINVAYAFHAPATAISGGSITTQELTASTINGVPNTQGYTDTTTFQYNYVDPVLGFQAGVVLSTMNTIGYIVNRPLAPINYFNIAYSSVTALDTYFLQFSTISAPPALYGPYYFSTVGSGVPEVYEQSISSISTTTTQPLMMCLSTSAGLTLYSLTLGFN